MMKKIVSFFICILLACTSYAEQQKNETLFTNACKACHAGNYEQALTLYCQVLKQTPDIAAVHYNIGLCLMALNKNDAALQAFHATLGCDPSYIKAHHELAALYSKKKNYEKALYHFEKTITTASNIDDLKMLGFLLIKNDQLEKAAACYKQALKLDEKNTKLLYNYAYTLNKLNQHEKALINYAQAHALNPEDEKCSLGLSKMLLALGKYTQAWPLFEARIGNMNNCHKKLAYETLSLADLYGKKVLLLAEWGLGDTLQFVRYAKVLKEQGATVILQTYDALIPLLSNCPFIDTILSTEMPCYDFDQRIPLLSMPLICNTTLETIPTPIPYLHADQKLIEYWHEKLAADTNYKIGICWHAKPIFLEDHSYTRRSIPLALFKALANLDGVTLYSLQKETGMDELTTEQQFPLTVFSDLDEEHGRFMDTAALVKNLDLVISADTSIVHLAGGLGVPTWVLLPYTAEWRWLHERTDTPWYPKNMQLFRQKEPGNWQSVINTVIDELKNRIQRKP